MYHDIDALPLAIDQQPWLKEIVGTAGLPNSLDREGGAIALGKLLGRPVSPETLRRWPIPYKVVAGCARYEVSDLIAYAKAQYENAPRRMGRRGLRSGLVGPAASRTASAHTPSSHSSELLCDPKENVK
jgi:hypothetical protein